METVDMKDILYNNFHRCSPFRSIRFQKYPTKNHRGKPQLLPDRAGFNLEKGADVGYVVRLFVPALAFKVYKLLRSTHSNSRGKPMLLPYRTRFT